MSALQTDDGQQLVPIVLIFGHFHRFKVRFCEAKFLGKNWKNYALFLKPKGVK